MVGKALGALACIAASLGFVSASSASAAGTVGWAVHSFADPTHFSPNDHENCGDARRCDRYQLVIRNVGDATSSGPIEVTDRLPPGITTTGESGETREVTGASWECAAPEKGSEKVNVVKCSYSGTVAPEGYTTVLAIPTTAPNADDAAIRNGECLLKGMVVEGQMCVERNMVEVSGGGASTTVSTVNDTPISTEAPPFEVTSFGFNAIDAGGAKNNRAGAHPYDVTATFELSNIFQPTGVEGESATQTEPVENIKTVMVDLPAGFLGDAQATPTCPEYDLVKSSVGSEREKSACPPGSRIGLAAVNGEGDLLDSTESSGPSAIYNMKPQTGYPAEFAFAFAEKTIYMYATVVHTGSGYRLWVVAPGIPAAIGLVGTSLTFFGDPAGADGSPGPHTAFLTNPADCSAPDQAAGLLNTKIEADSWENPGRWVSAESETYPEIAECNLLQFDPSVEVGPSPSSQGGTTEADEPSAYTVDLKVPQSSQFEEHATPQVRDATVTLPEGVSVSPSAANGLVGCQAEGPEGINIGSGELGHEGQDLKDPEATELGAGHAGGNGSPYDDGLYHTAHGHCPSASTLGTVEIFTPLLPNGPNESAPLHGHVYLAQPKCGGEGQPACTEASATNGELFGLYLEAAGSGVIVKLPGTVSANPSTGQLTGTFKENPQLPFGELKLHFKGGPRAPLANPADVRVVHGDELADLVGFAGSLPVRRHRSAWTGMARAARAPRAYRSARPSARVRPRRRLVPLARSC